MLCERDLSRRQVKGSPTAKAGAACTRPATHGIFRLISHAFATHATFHSFIGYFHPVVEGKGCTYLENKVS